MLAVFAHFWLWFLVIFAIGVATALWIRVPETDHRVSRWLLWNGLAFAAGLIVAALHILVGRPGLWLETGLISFATFLIGSLVGIISRSGDLRDHRGWALGLFVAGLVWFLGNVASTPALEADIRDKADATVKEAGGDPQKIDVNGRDVTLERGAGDRAALANAIGKVAGVGQVLSLEKTGGEESGGEKNAESKPAPVEQGAPADKSASADHSDAGKSAAINPPAQVPAADIKAEVDKALVEPKSVASAAPRTVVTADNAKSVLAALPPSGAFDASKCQAALSAIVALEKIQFRTASATIHLPAAHILDKVAGVMKRCPGTSIEVGGHTDNVGDDEDNSNLSQRRADAVARYLARVGVAASRLSAAGYGAKKPVVSNDTEEGRAENRRIEFIVK